MALYHNMGYVTRYPTEPDEESWPEYDVEKSEDNQQDQPVDGVKFKVRLLWPVNWETG